LESTSIKKLTKVDAGRIGASTAAYLLKALLIAGAKVLLLILLFQKILVISSIKNSYIELVNLLEKLD